MKPKLSEKPRDWIQFTISVCIATALVFLLLVRRRTIHRELMWIGFAVLSGAVVLSVLRPIWFRPFYRSGMTVSFYLGQFVGRILLLLIFLVVLTPLGLILRVLGKDLLHLKRDSAAESYWRSAKRSVNLDRQF